MENGTWLNVAGDGSVVTSLVVSPHPYPKWAPTYQPVQLETIGGGGALAFSGMSAATTPPAVSAVITKAIPNVGKDDRTVTSTGSGIENQVRDGDVMDRLLRAL
jgi:hypothetical protein